MTNAQIVLHLLDLIKITTKEMYAFANIPNNDGRDYCSKQIDRYHELIHKILTPKENDY